MKCKGPLVCFLILSLAGCGEPTEFDDVAETDAARVPVDEDPFDLGWDPRTTPMNEPGGTGEPDIPVPIPIGGGLSDCQLKARAKFAKALDACDDDFGIPGKKYKHNPLLKECYRAARREHADDMRDCQKK